MKRFTAYVTCLDFISGHQLDYYKNFYAHSLEEAKDKARAWAYEQEWNTDTGFYDFGWEK